MKRMVKTKDMEKEDWLKYRRLGIGGSDASSILGINPYRSVLRLWEEKTGRVEIKDQETDIQHFGHIMEDIIRKEFERRTGLKVRRSNYILQSDDHPFMIADLDGIVRDENGDLCVFEAKTASEFKKKVWEGGIPQEYMAQIQHYLAVTGYGKAYIASIVGGNSFFYYAVDRDEDYIKALIEKEEEFWYLVLNGNPPIADGAKATTEYLAKNFSKAVPDEITLPDQAKELIDRYEKVVMAADDVAQEKNEITNQLKQMLGKHESGTCDGRIVTWKTFTKNTLDTDKVKEKLGEDYEDYLKESSYRKFMIA